MPTRLRSWVSGLLVATCLLACKPTVEGESREWSSNLAAASEFEGRWPGFASALGSTRKEAEGLMKAADEITSDEARAAAMDAANKVLAPLVGKLRAVATKLDELDAAARRLDRLRVDEAGQRKIDDVEQLASQTHAEVEKAMADAAPANQSAALRILDEQITRLDRAIDRCTSTFEELSQPEQSKPPVVPKG